MRRAVPFIFISIAVLLAVLVVPVRNALQEDDGPRGVATGPNIVVIMTDDQTLESMRVMPQTLELLGEQGTTFDDAIASYSVCCPSRATFLTGQYAHNHGVIANAPPQGGNDKLDHDETIATWLSDAGYATSHVGKYLNKYGETSPPVQPPGWDRWFGLIDPSTYHYFGYEALDNGKVVKFDEDDDSQYQTDVLAERSVEEIKALAAGERPFFLNIWVVAPHAGRGRGIGAVYAPAVAPRHAGAFADEELPKPESYDEQDVADKPNYVQAEVTKSESLLTSTYRPFLGSLLAVDDLVETVVNELSAQGVLEDTVIIFTSDNGFSFGEHHFGPGKLLPYEENVRVPLIIRGGGFPAGLVVDQPVVNVDIAPTILDLAGAEASLDVDGISLLPLALDDQLMRNRVVLIERPPQEGEPNPPIPYYSGVRTERYVYLEYSTDEFELYDLANDPYEVQNLHGLEDYAGIESVLAEALELLRDCEGENCREVTVTLTG